MNDYPIAKIGKHGKAWHILKRGDSTYCGRKTTARKTQHLGKPTCKTCVSAYALRNIA